MTHALHILLIGLAVALSACGARPAPPPPTNGQLSATGQTYADALAAHAPEADPDAFAAAVLGARAAATPAGLYTAEQYEHASFIMPLYMELADAAKTLIASPDAEHLRAAWLIAKDFGAGPSVVEVRQSMRLANAILDAAPPHDLLAEMAAHDFNATHGVVMMLRHEAMWIRAGTFPATERERPRRRDAGTLDAVADCLETGADPSACFADAGYAKHREDGVLMALDEEQALRDRLAAAVAAAP